jgi:hypothetical protein
MIAASRGEGDCVAELVRLRADVAAQDSVRFARKRGRVLVPSAHSVC